ncbi:MAG TPA: response regulator transcription factor [Rubrivivax sp.]|nr:response regulator transcription factor [Rubrivivax sp.]HPO18408.1 response regulator transcription factor [Rubrivivax sp.]
MKVLLVDDHPLILSALQLVIQGLGDDVSVRGTDSAAQARAALLEDADYDLVLLDLALGDADGFELLTELRAAYPSLPVVVVSASDRTSDVIRAIDLGAMGFVPKRSSNQQLFEALRMVMSGGLYVPPMMLGLDPPSADGDTAPGVMRPAGASGRLGDHPDHPEHRKAPLSLESVGLTPRQSDVLALLLQGKPNKLIARELNVSVETVKDHVAAVLRALGVSSRTQAVLAVSQMQQQAALGARPAPPPPR